MKRSGPIPRSPGSVRQWEQRSRERARASAERRRNVPIRGGFGKRGNGTPKRKPAPHIAAGFTLAAKGESECRYCGAPATDAHHAVPRSLSRAGRDDLRNLLPLCRTDHDRFHSGYPLPRELFTAEEFEFIETLVGPGWLDRRYPSRRDVA